MNAELTFLNALQALRTPALDGVMRFFTHLGDSGFVWVALTALLLAFRRTRRAGWVLAAALLFDAVLCNILLKPLRHPHGGGASYPPPGGFLLSLGAHGGILRVGDGSLAGREKAVGNGSAAVGSADRVLPDVPLRPLSDGYSGWCGAGHCLRLAGRVGHQKAGRKKNGAPSLSAP